MIMVRINKRQNDDNSVKGKKKKRKEMQNQRIDEI